MTAELWLFGSLNQWSLSEWGHNTRDMPQMVLADRQKAKHAILSDIKGQVEKHGRKTVPEIITSILNYTHKPTGNQCILDSRDVPCR